MNVEGIDTLMQVFGFKRTGEIRTEEVIMITPDGKKEKKEMKVASYKEEKNQN